MSHSTRRQFLQSAALCTAALTRHGWAQAPAPEASTVVHTPLGALGGALGNGVRVFRGIPFAQPPVGPLRFRPPAPPQPWSGVRDATHFAAAAVQAGDHEFPQSEDCLYLNVWTPAGATPHANLPVFVWIHGGGFTGGESFAPLFDGTEFAKAGLVVVTVAYRLGVLGFLDLGPLLGPAYAGSANNALRDLMAALRWVQGSIASFGGDTTRVTIGGESAGAKLTDILMGVPEARPLFTGMISESGGAERVWPKATAEGVAKGFGEEWTRGGRTLEVLKTAPAPQLIEVQETFLKTWPQHFPLRCEVDGTLLPRLPIQSIAAGSARGRRLLIGTNREESAMFIGPHPAHDPTAADLGNTSELAFARVLAEYANVYPDLTVEQRRIRATTAEEYWVPSVRVAEAEATAHGQVWMYELEYTRPSGRYKGDAFHTLDLPLVWDKPLPPAQGGTAGEANLATQIHAAWVAFLQGTTPAAAGLPTWPAFEAGSRETMILNTESRVEKQPQESELRLWDGIL